MALGATVAAALEHYGSNNSSSDNGVRLSLLSVLGWLEKENDKIRSFNSQLTQVSI